MGYLAYRGFTHTDKVHRNQGHYPGLPAHSLPLPNQGFDVAHRVNEIPLREEWDRCPTLWYRDLLRQEEILQDLIRSPPSVQPFCPHCRKDEAVVFPPAFRENTGNFHGEHRRPSLKAAFGFIAQLGSGAVSKVTRSWRRSRNKKSGDSMASVLDSQVLPNKLELTELDGLPYRPELQDSDVPELQDIMMAVPRDRGVELVQEFGVSKTIPEFDQHGAVELPTTTSHPLSPCEVFAYDSTPELPTEIDYPVLPDEDFEGEAISNLQKSNETSSLSVVYCPANIGFYNTDISNGISERSQCDYDCGPLSSGHRIHAPSLTIETGSGPTDQLAEDTSYLTTDHVMEGAGQDDHTTVYPSPVLSRHLLSNEIDGNIFQFGEAWSVDQVDAYSTDLRDQHEPRFGDYEVQSQQEVLGDFFLILHHLFELSLYKLSLPPISAAVSIFRIRMPKFEVLARMGMLALQKVLVDTRGHLPTSDMEIYALLHVAYACIISTSLYPIEIMYDELYENALEWTLAVEPREQPSFATIIRQIWDPKPSQARAVSQGDGFNSAARKTNSPRKTNGLSFQSANTSTPLWFDPETYCTSPGAYIHDSDNLLDTLQKGKVISACKQFLNSMYPSVCA